VASSLFRGAGWGCFGFGVHRGGAVLWNFNGSGRRKMFGDVRQSLVLLLMARLRDPGRISDMRLRAQLAGNSRRRFLPLHIHTSPPKHGHAPLPNAGTNSCNALQALRSFSFLNSLLFSLRLYPARIRALL
jgi:hypothetical protein